MTQSSTYNSTLLITRKILYKLDAGLINFKSCLPLLYTNIISKYPGAFLCISRGSISMPWIIIQGILSQMDIISRIFLTSHTGQNN